ncbi:MAG TPA: helix-turn-helix domain-containing protein [Chloroflexota bacterium]
MASPADSVDAALDASAEASARRERADAVRNRARILEAARAAFASEGLTCQIDEIARQAGVGTGTIYRNFPTKEALLEAILVDGVQQHTARARAAAGAGDPAAAFFDFLSTMVHMSCANKAFSETLADSGIDVQKAKAGASAELREAVGHLLQRAQQAGGVRHDVEVADLMALVVGTCQAASQYGGNVDWLIRVLRDGLRPTAVSHS